MVLPTGVILVLLWTGLASAQGAVAPSSSAMATADHTAERERIRREREAIDKNLQRTQVACYQRFAVEDCLRAARRQTRTDHAVLRQQESLMDDRERRERAAQRLQSIEDRRSARAADAPEPPAIASRASRPPRSVPRARLPASPPDAARTSQEQRRQALQMRAAEGRQRQMEKQQAALERKARAQQRQAQEAARGHQPAAPLTP